MLPDPSLAVVPEDSSNFQCPINPVVTSCPERKLPIEISDIQEELNQITKELKQSNLYIDNYDRYVEITKKMEDLNKKLSLKEDKWLEVLELEDKINKKNNE